MTRAEKITKAKYLRGEGLTYREIAERLDISPTTVCEYLTGNVSKAKRAWRKANPERDRAHNLARHDAKRKHEYESECPTCGGAKNRYVERCWDCRVEAERRKARERTERFIAMRKEGLLNYEIAEREGCAAHTVACDFSRAHRYGLEVPPSPYRPTAIREAA